MRTLMMAAAIVAVGSSAAAQGLGGRFGAGVVLGDPTGVTGKYYFDRTKALDLGIGFSGDATFYADFQWHAWDVFPQPEKGVLGGYISVGPRIETKRDTHLGLRTLGGMAYQVAQRPFEVFLEAGPVFRLDPDEGGVDFDAGLGVRYFFGG